MMPALPKGFVAHIGRHENRLSRHTRPTGPGAPPGWLDRFNAERYADGLPRLWATKGWEKLPKPRHEPAHVAGEASETLAQRMLYGFMGYWR